MTTLKNFIGNPFHYTMEAHIYKHVLLVLQTANEHLAMNDWQTGFVTGFLDKINNYKEGTAISGKQAAVLYKLEQELEKKGIPLIDMGEEYPSDDDERAAREAYDSSLDDEIPF